MRVMTGPRIQPKHLALLPPLSKLQSSRRLIPLIQRIRQPKLKKNRNGRYSSGQAVPTLQISSSSLWAIGCMELTSNY